MEAGAAGRCRLHRARLPRATPARKARGRSAGEREISAICRWRSMRDMLVIGWNDRPVHRDAVSVRYVALRPDLENIDGGVSSMRSGDFSGAFPRSASGAEPSLLIWPVRTRWESISRRRGEGASRAERRASPPEESPASFRFIDMVCDIERQRGLPIDGRAAIMMAPIRTGPSISSSPVKPVALRLPLFVSYMRPIVSMVSWITSEIFLKSVMCVSVDANTSRSAVLERRRCRARYRGTSHPLMRYLVSLRRRLILFTGRKTRAFADVERSGKYRPARGRLRYARDDPDRSAAV